MLSAISFAHVIVLVFGALLLWAAANDVLHYQIPNRISAGIVLLFPAYVLAGTSSEPLTTLLSGLGVAAAVFLLGAAGFAAGVVGGGDAKLLAAVSLWAGPALVIPFFVVTALGGAVLALAMLTPLATLLPAPPASIASRSSWRNSRGSVPYGVAIAAGGLFVARQLAGI